MCHVYSSNTIAGEGKKKKKVNEPSSGVSVIDKAKRKSISANPQASAAIITFITPTNIPAWSVKTK